MAKVNDAISMDGTILECLPSTHFKVELDNGITINCIIAGKLRMN